MDEILTILFLSIGLIIGSKAPDLDLTPVLPIRHRSVFTHGPLFPLAALWIANTWPALTWLCIGFVSACALHLLEDAGPKSWKGSANINCFPLPISFHWSLSFLYIFGSALVALWVAVRL